MTKQKQHPTKITVQYNGEDVKGIVHSFVHIKPWKGNPQDCPSDLDWYGYTEIDWEFVSSSELDYWLNYSNDNELNWKWFTLEIERKLIDEIRRLKEQQND